MHADTHACRHTRTHTRTHARTYVRTHARALDARLHAHTLALTSGQRQATLQSAGSPLFTNHIRLTSKRGLHFKPEFCSQKHISALHEQRDEVPASREL